ASAFEPGDHGSTFGGTPIATAAARAVLDELVRIDAPVRAERAGRRLGDALAATEGVKEVRGMGLLLAAELDGGDAKEINAALLQRGLVANAVTPTAVRFAPPITVSDHEIDEAVTIVAEVLRA